VTPDRYEQLITLLDENQARYRLIDHAPEGRTEIVSALRGHAPGAAAKCVVVMLKLGKKTTRYVLAVVPGDARVDMNALRARFEATYVSFASAEIAERLAGSVSGTILPFSFSPELALIVDRAVLEREKLFFNAARLDRSIALRADDYARIAKPRVERIATAALASAAGR
jgi:Ala-tRNA(Pro) deacylase